MWQVMLAAAVAGSGFFAKRFLSTTTTNSDDPNTEADTKCDQSKELQQQQQHLTTPSKPQLAIPLAFQSCNDCKSESETQSSTAVGDGSIFMFSSPVSKGGTGSRFGSKKSGGNREGFKTSGFEKVERKCGGFDQSKSGKKFAVCLKKRRTSKNSPGKCESCSSKGAKALVEKNMRDLLAQREQAERNRLAEALDAEVKRWSSGKEANLRALLSTLQYILGPDSGWQPIPLTEVITSAAVKKAYRKATLCVHPDKLQQRGASVQQKYICEKVFDLLKRSLEQIQLRGAVDGHCSTSCSKGKLKLRDCQGRNVGERRRFISFASSLQTL
ncbi:unnamed protein product [Camellia sinensis]